MAIAVCARINHPKGWGRIPPEAERPRFGSYEGEAHGYVLIFVTGLMVPEDLSRLRSRLLRPVRDPFGPGWLDWYGGQFDVVATIPNGQEVVDAWGAAGPTRVRSIGDNRAYLTISLDDLMLCDQPSQE
jgi:hypothetical protein